jgi:hypothetical protein
LEYLDESRLAAQDERAFQGAHPYPWCNPAGLLRADAYEALSANLPSLDIMRPCFGKARKHGQRSHDRYALTYSDGLDLPEPWRGFVDELQGPDYRAFLARMIGSDNFELDFHWHYTPNGCSVSPHCDAWWKLGSHIFYFNTEADWSPDWGGETVILDDRGRFSFRSAPNFGDFDHAYGSNALGNNSLLFIRNGRSWHGVREIACPEGKLRKVFIVVIKRRNLATRLKSLVA